MRRREVVLFFGTALCGSPVWGQQTLNPKRIGVLTGLSEDNPAAQSSIEALGKALEEQGWHEGQNLRVTYRFAAGDPEKVQRYARELVERQPDVIVAHTALVVATLHQATQRLPVVFVSIPDPVADGFVESLSHPGGNMTGFTNYDFTIGSKWLEILKEIAPETRRVSVLLNPDAEFSYSSYSGYWRSVEAAAPATSVIAELAPGRNPDEIERVIAALAREPGGGLIVTPSPIIAYLRQIIELSARYRIPSIYAFGAYARQGGLVSYGTDLDDLFRRAADYVHRILNGEKPANLPIQGPTKFELVINLKTANALGLSVPQLLLQRADEVIE